MQQHNRMRPSERKSEAPHKLSNIKLQNVILLIKGVHLHMEILEENQTKENASVLIVKMIYTKEEVFNKNIFYG
jgi:hypothetical protein